MSGIDFKDITTLISTNNKRTNLIESVQKSIRDLDTLAKLDAIKEAIQHDSTEGALSNIKKIKRIDEVLEISTEDLVGKSPASKLDVYRTNILEKSDKLIRIATEAQADVLAETMTTVNSYRTIINEFKEAISFAVPIVETRLTPAFKDRIVCNFATVTHTDYINRVSTFKNRLGYILTFFNPRASLEGFDMSEFVPGMPYSTVIPHEKFTDILIVKPIACKEKIKVTSLDWTPNSLLQAYEQYVNTDVQFCDMMDKVFDTMPSIKKDTTILAKRAIVTTSMMNLVDDYVHTQKLFMCMFYNILKK
jgi:hypothetical protein